MTELSSNTMNPAQFARLLLTLQPLLQKVEREGSEMPPLEELLRFADAQRDSKCKINFPVLTMQSTAHFAPAGEDTLSVSNETTAKATSIGTTAGLSSVSSAIVDDKRPVGAAAVDQQSPLMLTPVKRTPAQVQFGAIEAALSPTRPVPSTQGGTKRSSPVTLAQAQLDAIEGTLSPTRVPDTQVLQSSISPGPMSPTPDHLLVHHFGLKQTAWEEDPELAPFLSFKSLEEIVLGHKLNGFVCSNCNHYNRVRELEDEE